MPSEAELERAIMRITELEAWRSQMEKDQGSQPMKLRKDRQPGDPDWKPMDADERRVAEQNKAAEQWKGSEGPKFGHEPSVGEHPLPGTRTPPPSGLKPGEKELTESDKSKEAFGKTAEPPKAKK